MQLHRRFIVQFDLILIICFPQITLNNLMLLSNILFRAGFFVEMDLFTPCSWRMYLVLYTDIKLNKSRSSITVLSVFFHWDFCCPDLSRYYPILQLSKATIVWSIQITSIALRLRENFWNPTSWHSKFFRDWSLVHILGHLHCVHPSFFGNFRHDFS